MKQTTKRLISFVLCFVMVLGMLPVLSLNADAAEGDVSHLMFASDRHANTTVIGNVINNVESAIGEDELDYLALCGDMVGSGESHPSYNSSTVLSEVEAATSSLNAENVDIVAGIHDVNVNDDAGIVLDYMGGGAVVGEGADYYVYGVEEYCIAEESDAENWAAQASAFVEWANSDDVDKSKVIFVASHYPLHAKRGDNPCAGYWHNALNTVATGSATGTEVVRDVVFFHGHNHTVDSTEYCYTPGSVLSIESYIDPATGLGMVPDSRVKVFDPEYEVTATASGSDATVYYTYATAGYLNQNKKATLVTLTEDQIVLTKYGTSGSGTQTAVIDRVAQETEPEVTEPTVETVVGVEETTQDTVTATGLGLTGVILTWNDEVDTSAFYDCVPYDVALEGYIEGETVTLVFDVAYMDAEELVVWANGEFVEPLSVVNATAEDDFYSVQVTLETQQANGTYIIGHLAAAEDAVLTGIEVESLPEITGYVAMEGVGENTYLDITGLVINAVYDNGQTVPLDWNQFDETRDGYALSFDLSTSGTKTVTVTYGEFETSFEVTVYGSTVANVTEDETVAAAVAGTLKGGFVAQDINLEGYEQGTWVRVVLAAPAGANMVCHVAEDGTLEVIENVTFRDGYAIFDTNHFSVYAVGESSVPQPTTQSGTYEMVTNEDKTAYVLVSSASADNQYIIVNINTAGSGYALKENTTTGSTVTVNAAGNGISNPYIETTDETIMWNTESGLTFQSENGSYYLRYSNGLSFSTRSSTDWTYRNNRLYYSRYYLRNSSGTWSASSNQSSVYLYEKQTVTIQTTKVVNGIYSVEVENLKKVVDPDSTVTAQLNAVPVFTSEDGERIELTNSLTYEELDENNIISSISGNTVTFSGNIGTAVVKVSYETASGTVTNYITVEASAPYYTLAIMDGEVDVTGDTVAIKGITDKTTLQLSTLIKYFDGTNDGEVVEKLPDDATLTWNIPAEYQNIATVDQNGLVSFTGKEGAFYLTVTLTVGEVPYTVGVNISATLTSYVVPEDGTADFPEYPNEGAIRYDKTATAVGNFSETGIAQVELSMTGVPYTTGSEIDVVLMLDMTGSMDDVTDSDSEPTGYVRVDASIAAAKEFIKSIVINENGTYNDNRIGIYVFNANGASTLYELAEINTEEKLQNLIGKVGDSGEEFGSDYKSGKLDTIWTDFGKSGGTPYADGLEKCYDVLNTAKTDGKGNDRQQFTVFMTDGVPTTYEYINGNSHSTYSSANTIAGMLTTSSNYATRDTDYKYEYYSTEMKKSGVVVYTVGVGLFNENNAWDGTATQCGNLASALLNDISGPANETEQPDEVGTATLSKKDSYFFSVEDQDAAADMVDVFSNIAYAILQAATDVKVEDQINDAYTMIFDIPEGDKPISGVTNDFYIEFGKYTLDATDHERTDTFQSVTKVYLQNTNDTLSVKDGTAPVFEQKTLGDKGTLYYWSTKESDGDSGVSVTSGGTTYYFVSTGMETAGYNMTSGAYAYGTVDDKTNMSQNLVIATPYFVYNAGTRMLYWTLDKLQDATTEYVLRYFLYLENSATQIGMSNEVDPGSYQTNVYANLTYTNYKGNDCQVEFPVPQLTWNGAQVSYVFYLVNAQGQPINKSGQIVDFANASFVTDVYTESVVWNKAGDTSTGTGQLSADWLAIEKLPDDYMVYDEKAQFLLNVYEKADGTTLQNQFTIAGGSAAEIAAYLNGKLTNVNVTAGSVTTTKVYNTKAGEKVTGYGNYYSTDDDMKGMDFANLTVAFAVVWQPALAPDTVVVDYGLDVLINVLENDLLQDSEISGIGLSASAYGSTAMNSGIVTDSRLGESALSVGDNTVSIENTKQIRFHQGDMNFTESVTFYYESEAKYYENSASRTGYMYSSVTVVPATTIYFEDSYVDLSVWDMNDNKTTEQWETVGTSANDTQDQDRPGESTISGVIDADNSYGYDSAYTDCGTFSMGSARKVRVNNTKYAEAQFTFTGTGFDIISLTSNLTGTIAVDVYDAVTFKNAPYTGLKDTLMVDTYYGFTKDGEGNWVEDPTAANSLYQVPVIKLADLPYASYTVVITVAYNGYFDHQKVGYCDFYLDAIRIYDPANDGASDDVVENAYIADGEGWPSYIELRNSLISANSFGEAASNQQVTGMVFIDGIPAVDSTNIKDYISYGPNNEVYLAAGQSVAFMVNAPANLAKMQIGLKSADGNPVSYSIKNVAAVAVGAVKAGETYNEKSFTVNTATDMYYDMTAWTKDIVVISNTGTNGILSITNIKSTYKSDPNGSGDTQNVDEDLFEVSVYMTPEAAAVTLNAKKPAVNPFADVLRNQFFYESVLWAVENGITNGVDATHFGPYLFCNRAQVVTFLWRAAGSPAPVSRENPFVDVPEDSWYTDAVLWAVENGITNGLTADTFGPNEQCNRAQVVTFLWRANGSKVVDAENPFVDVPANAFYRDAVVWALQNGITTGASATAFDPNGICMRAHVVTFLYRAEQLPEVMDAGDTSEN